MAAGHVMQTAVRARRIIKANPTGQMRQRLRPRPVRIILMPSDYTAMSSGLAKQLVVPETHGTAQELRRRDGELRMPQNIMKARRDAPRTERVKEFAVSLIGFVAMKFVK